MIRKAVIIVLILAAGTTAFLACLSFSRTLKWRSGVPGDVPSTRVGLANGGLWFRHTDHIPKPTLETNRSVHFIGAFCEGIWMQSVRSRDAAGARVELPNVRVIHGSVPLWMPFVLFLLYPAIVWNARMFRRVVMVVLLMTAILIVFCVLLRLPRGQVFDWHIGAHTQKESVGYPIHPGEGEWDWSVPIWLMPVLFAAYPTIAFIRGPFRRYRRRRKGLCLRCGYDLTGNVSGVCPECGSEVKQP
jgi:hypothetical protein